MLFQARGTQPAVNAAGSSRRALLYGVADSVLEGELAYSYAIRGCNFTSLETKDEVWEHPAPRGELSIPIKKISL